MSSNAIYHTANDRTPYTYLVGWTSLNKWYYGKRTANGCHPTDLWVKYFTSSIYVKEFRTIHGEPDVIQVRKIFKSITNCNDWETKFLTKVDACNNNMFLNKTNGDTKFDNTGKVNVIDSDGNRLNVYTDDPKYLSGEYISIKKGIPNSINDIEQWKQSCKNSLLRSYGVDNPGKTKASRNKARMRMLGENNPSHNMSADTKEKHRTNMLVRLSNMSENDRSNTFGRTGELNHFYGITYSQEEKCAMSVKNSIYNYIITSPTGEVFNTHSLKKFCDENNLNRDIFMKYVGKGIIPTPRNFGKETRMNSVGWSIDIILDNSACTSGAC